MAVDRKRSPAHDPPRPDREAALDGQVRALSAYVRDKVDQLLLMMGSRPLDARELDDAALLALDPIGTISDAFAQVLARQHELNEKLRVEVGERRRTEEALREKEERFRTLAEFGSDMAFWRATDGAIHYVSPACEPITGYPPEAFYADPGLMQAIIHPDDRDRWDRHVHARDDLGGPTPSEYRIVTRAGETRWISHVCRPVRGDDGTFLGFRGSHANVTERRRAEEALRESERRLRDFLDNALDLIQSVGPDGRFLYVNRAWKQTLGYSDEEVTRFTVFDVIDPAHHEECAATMARVMAGEDVGRIETRFVAKDGRRIPVVGNANCRFEDGRPVSTRSIFRDVSEEERLDEEIRKASTLDSIGILAGGIAHDFNNLLAAILGQVSLARLGLVAGADVGHRLEEAERACLRAKALTQQLLTFSKGGAPIRQAAAVREIIGEAARFALRGSKARCDADLPEDLWPVDVDGAQVGQAIGNIVINADQAMPEGGTVAVRARNVDVARGEAQGLSPGPYVRIDIRDQGAGIPPEVIPKIFDPFFTTKAKGTGLGLSTAYSIVRRHGGTVAVASRVGEGTTVSLWIPAARRAPARAPAPTRARNGRSRILVMDDEESLRDVTLGFLRAMGYEGTAVRDGAEALAAYRAAREAGTPFDAVIMDLTIPGGMGGKEAVRRLLEIDPEARAVVSSGYSNDPVMADYRAHGFRGVIAKPYRMKDLAAVLQGVVGP